jgi:hypothetical protein
VPLFGKYSCNSLTPDLLHRCENTQLIVDQYLIIRRIETFDVIKLLLGYRTRGGANPIGVPGCPDFACRTASSIDSARMQLIDNWANCASVIGRAPPLRWLHSLLRLQLRGEPALFWRGRMGRY